VQVLKKSLTYTQLAANVAAVYKEGKGPHGHKLL